jgi:molybdopterin molybdotransferase
VGEIQAGQSEVDYLQVNTAYRIMTGAAVPLGFDTIIPFEEVKVLGDWIVISKSPKQGDHIRLAGEDVLSGDVVISRGRVLRPADIGVLATIGCVKVSVYQRPVVAVITTGNELIDAADYPGFGKIRDANIYSLCAQVMAVGAVPVAHPHIPDQLNIVVDVLKSAVAESDVILINGGVSVGDFDYTKLALKKLGAEQIFWRVAQKPGGPLGLWILDGKMVFGIPGNPVAAMIMFEEYVRPVLRIMMGYKYAFRPERTGIMGVDCKLSADGRMNFLRVIANFHDQHLCVIPTGPQGSGLLSSMMSANALALIPAEAVTVPAGSEVLLHLIDEQEDH